MGRLINKIKSKFATLYKKYGWKAVVGLVLYYLIRDITIYIIIPTFAVQSLVK